MQQFSSLSQSDEINEVVSDSMRAGAATASLASALSSTAASQGSKDQVSPVQGKSTGSITPPPSAATDKVSRFIVIPAERKRPKSGATASVPEQHINPHLRQVILVLTTVVVLSVTLFTLLPLYADQSGVQLPGGLNTLVQSVQHSWPILAYQQAVPTVAPTVANVSTHESAPPLPRSQYVAMAEQDATAVGISPTYFVNQINLESGFNPNAASPGGAEGIAQFMPGTAAGLGIDPWDPVQALRGAAQMMANLYHQYGDYAKALGSYNAGSGTLQNAVNSCGANWLSCMPAQTQNYVATIMGT